MKRASWRSKGTRAAQTLVRRLGVSNEPIISDLRDLSRPVRRRTHFPTMFAFYNALKRLQTTSTDALEDLEYLHGQLEEILEHARRERINRK